MALVPGMNSLGSDNSNPPDSNITYVLTSGTVDQGDNEGIHIIVG